MLTNEKYLRECIANLKLDVSDKQIEQFSNYYSLVVQSNKKFNLTAITEEKDFIDKHFIDSLTGIEFFDNGKSVCDIGAGGGFPSIPLAIMREDLNFLCLDSTAKKMRFVLDSAKSIGLSNVNTKAGRAEEQKDLKNNFDYVIARAVSALPILLELSIPLLKVGGKFIAYKTDESEINDVKIALSKLNAKYINSKLIKLPNGDSRAVLVFEKVGATNPIYPRVYGTIKKKPL